MLLVTCRRLCDNLSVFVCWSARGLMLIKWRPVSYVCIFSSFCVNHTPKVSQRLSKSTSSKVLWNLNKNESVDGHTPAYAKDCNSTQERKLTLIKLHTAFSNPPVTNAKIFGETHTKCRLDNGEYYFMFDGLFGSVLDALRTRKKRWRGNTKRI